MRKHVVLALLALGLALPAARAVAADREPVVYTVVPGDTLWGLSERFFNDPHYWPNLWAANPDIANPHFIYPGQQLRFYENRVEIVPAPAPPAPTATAEKQSAVPTPPPEALPEQPAKGKDFRTSGGEGYLLERDLHPAGFILSTHQNRQIVGEDDIVYTDIGRVNGANVGDRYTIYTKLGAVSHPVTNVILGYKVIPLGDLQLSEVEEKASKAIITRSYQEITAGAYLMPYRDRRVVVPLKAADRDLVGYIVETQTGNQALAVGDVVFLDLGRSHGIKRGNLLYIVRDVAPDQRYAQAKIESLPVEVVGALVVTETGFNTSTAVIVKSVDTIYRGDRVELKKSR
ncbi:LysM peptidoglycan-binding domain-containing protein [Geomesophilobacter sediminis]|uniref:LysM peptidoglycan-binding domain-containing protein n=1 Tax=Geomesophilobacter sediminis TaxID=2798584 RepID=A0A8J7JJV1_9BACT|nr:LysM domain-containing protein [Geomesophilobacter sediminis]MBJ6723290.1 LysM peptidoglycan-binding domain-containing protein [Geomesophilobacter sediminis]